MKPIRADQGLLAHMIKTVRPDLLPVIRETNRIETAVIGLGGQGTRHAGMMRKFGSCVIGGIAPGRQGEMVDETIPVYDSVAECMAAHPFLAAVSIWRHFSSARDAALDAIAAGVPIIVLITEWIPLRDVRDILAAADERGSLLLGGNTPGAIFPPERIKVGMLPDVFHPAEPEPGQAGPGGVTILSRSGAILYHMSDALASTGVAQNGVIGVGGDGAIGSTFRDLVPLVMTHDATDLVVVAGEIGGAQEEYLAEDITEHPEKYPKPLVALISGSRAPAGKTMGHAGAIVAPGQEFGTFKSKRDALSAAGVRVVNSQYDLIEVVKEILGTKTYFTIEKYYERMQAAWEQPPPPPSWGTRITGVAPNRLTIAGYALEDLVRQVDLVTATHLLVTGDLPDGTLAAQLAEEAKRSAAAPAEGMPAAGEDVQLSTALAARLLADPMLKARPVTDPGEQATLTVRALGRAVRHIADVLGHGDAVAGAPDFGTAIARAVGAPADFPPHRVKLVESLAVASVDHGVTPPSAQATLMAATVRAPYEMALASGAGAITDVHGGAGADAANFFLACVKESAEKGIPVGEAAYDRLDRASRTGLRVSGMGHRVHTEDPRRNVIWEIAESAGAAGPCVALSKMMERLFAEVRGFGLPINVDGVIGAVVADLGLPPIAAKALFILGRVAGLSAHYFEEVRTQPPMRRIRFDQAAYRGPLDRILSVG
jgi:succinyl-CoA synthetase alpha subunit